MQLNRRQFNRGALALSGTAAMPSVPVPMTSGAEDAYSAIISELVRVEEAAQAAGAGSASSGAVSLTGRQLESFIGHMDMQVSPFESAGQVYRALRGMLKQQAKEAAREADRSLRRAVRDARDAQPKDAEPVSAPAQDETAETAECRRSPTSSGQVS